MALRNQPAIRRRYKYPDDPMTVCANCETEQPIADMEPPGSHRYKNKDLERYACAECGSYRTNPRVGVLAYQGARATRLRWEQPFPDGFPSLLDALADEA